MMKNDNIIYVQPRQNKLIESRNYQEINNRPEQRRFNDNINKRKKQRKQGINKKKNDQNKENIKQNGNKKGGSLKQITKKKQQQQRQRKEQIHIKNQLTTIKEVSKTFQETELQNQISKDKLLIKKNNYQYILDKNKVEKNQFYFQNHYENNESYQEEQLNQIQQQQQQQQQQIQVKNNYQVETKPQRKNKLKMEEQISQNKQQKKQIRINHCEWKQLRRNIQTRSQQGRSRMTIISKDKKKKKHKRCNSNELLVQGKHIQTQRPSKSRQQKRFRKCGCPARPKTPSPKKLQKYRPQQIIVSEKEYSSIISQYQERKPQVLQYRIQNLIQQLVHYKISDNVIMRTIIQRDNSGFNQIWPIYHMYFTYNQTLILKAKKCKFSICSKYNIYTKSIQNEDILVGRVESNYNGNVFNIYESLNESKFYLVCSVMYINLHQHNKPQQFQVYYVEKINKTYQKNYIKQMNIKSLKDLINNNKDKNINNNNNIIKKGLSKKAVWNKYENQYQINFNKRAKLASSRNFILQDEQYKKQMLMLGKLQNDIFKFQISAGLNPIVSLGIMLTKFQNRGY